MDLFRYRAFATELLKIAQEGIDPQKNEVLDPDVRALKAERDGREYLQGGQLRSNSQLDTNWVPKIAGRLKRTQYQLNATTNALNQLKSSDDLDMSAGSQARRYGLAGLGGALTGSGITRATEYVARRVPIEHANLARAAQGLEGLHWKPFTQKTHIIAPAAGAGLALTDRFLRERRRKKMLAGLQKDAMVQQFTPARALKAGQETTKFHAQQIHEGNTRDAAGILGKKFRIG